MVKKRQHFIHSAIRSKTISIYSIASKRLIRTKHTMIKLSSIDCGVIYINLTQAFNKLWTLQSIERYKLSTLRRKGAISSEFRNEL